MTNLAFATRDRQVCNSGPEQDWRDVGFTPVNEYVLVVDPAKLSPALLEALAERGAMRITVPQA